MTQAMIQYAIPVQRNGANGYDVYDSTGYLAYSCVSYQAAKSICARMAQTR